MRKTAPKYSAENLRIRLKLKNFEAKALLAKKHPQVDKFLKYKNLDLSRIRDYSANLISTGALAGALLLNAPADLKFLPTPQEILGKIREKDSSDSAKTPDVNKKQVLTDALKDNLPERARPLKEEEEKLLEQVLSATTEVPVKATLEGEHLNQTYGYIGAEQHLRRYPGDSISQHDKKTVSSGMAPGLGAWGYFAKSKDEMDPSLTEKEKWYAVVQTLYLPDWNKRAAFLKGWYKYRKVLIVNTVNGNAVVADIADSGPAAWTGKQYGGSPEVMDALGGPRYRKGAVLVFFVDDPDNKIPLGPVKYN